MANDPNYPDSYDKNEPGEGTPSDPDASKEGSEDMGETTLVPSSFFGGDCKVGDKYTVEVVRKHEGELEVRHVGESESSNDSEPSMEKAHATLNAMGTEA